MENFGMDETVRAKKEQKRRGEVKEQKRRGEVKEQRTTKT